MLAEHEFIRIFHLFYFLFIKASLFYYIIIIQRHIHILYVRKKNSLKKSDGKNPNQILIQSLELPLKQNLSIYLLYSIYLSCFLQPKATHKLLVFSACAEHFIENELTVIFFIFKLKTFYTGMCGARRKYKQFVSSVCAVPTQLMHAHVQSV